MRYLTAGESHGPWLVTIIEGLPAQLPLDLELVADYLRRRRLAAGRGPRMGGEDDAIEVMSGTKDGVCLGSPLTMSIANRVRDRGNVPLTVPRPGHADLAGSVKYELNDLRDVAERASARETAARTAVGAVAVQLLAHLEITVASAVETVGGVSDWRYSLEQAAKAGDTLGGTIIVSVAGLCGGVGTYVHWDRRLDVRLGAAVLGIPGVKGVEFGHAFADCSRPGSEYQDQFSPAQGQFRRSSNRAGGIEGGMSNGEAILMRVAVKPVPTQAKPLASFDMSRGQAAPAPVVRHDTCVAEAAAIVAEAVCAWEIAAALMDQFSGDTLGELQSRYFGFREKWLQRTRAWK